MKPLEHDEQRREGRPLLRLRAIGWLDEKVPDGVAVTSDGKPYTGKDGKPRRVPADYRNRFFELTGATQDSLEVEWKKTSLTTCNAFCGRFSDAMGLGSLNVLSPPDYLKQKGRYAAWVPADSGARPRPGDIAFFKFAKHWHTNVTRSVSGDQWITVDGGQGGKGTGRDVVTRVEHSFSESRANGEVQGWVDIEIYATLLASQALTKTALGHLWFDQDGRLTHPDAPAGAGGPGGFRSAGPLSVDADRVALWHPDAPADLHLPPPGSLDLIAGRSA